MILAQYPPDKIPTSFSPHPPFLATTGSDIALGVLIMCGLAVVGLVLIAYASRRRMRGPWRREHG